jgi:hypothetical protein
MPVYLITLHGYGTHLPDDPSGSYHWRRGFQPPNEALADRYRSRLRAPAASFSAPQQGAIVEEARRSAALQGWSLLGIACEPTHAHLVAAWRERARPVESVRASIKSSLTRRLNRDFGSRKWFSARGACTRVEEEKHLEFLLEEYLPGHRGHQWYAEA